MSLKLEEGAVLTWFENRLQGQEVETGRVVRMSAQERRWPKRGWSQQRWGSPLEFILKVALAGSLLAWYQQWLDCPRLRCGSCKQCFDVLTLKFLRLSGQLDVQVWGLEKRMALGIANLTKEMTDQRMSPV